MKDQSKLILKKLSSFAKYVFILAIILLIIGDTVTPSPNFLSYLSKTLVILGVILLMLPEVLHGKIKDIVIWISILLIVIILVVFII
ncbi:MULTISPECIES: hypothetical protein [Staphylococcus]|uniref:Uncharacterized protein n=1 Tax=Staphylococcus hsinchuensis TaxID=3051183 RepID=A0ABZ3ECP5_9STAP|nr:MULTISPECIES: hypothetical protein [unclassified Staphylococcus]